MKTFNEWLELREAGFFSNLFGKKPAPAPSAQVGSATPVPKGMSVDDFQRLFDGPNAKQAQASNEPEAEQKPAPQIRQPQMAPPKANSNPVEYIENIANKYWKGKGEYNEMWEYWQQSRQENDKNRRGRLVYKIYSKLSYQKYQGQGGPTLDAAMDKLVDILDEECNWRPFPESDEAIAGTTELNLDNVDFFNGRKVFGAVRVIVKGFKRGADVRQKAVVERNG
jgi:hypothetical protein